MNHERWHHVKRHLLATLELSPSDRTGYLDVVCADDPSLRIDIERLLAAHKDAAASEFLSDRAMAVARGALGSPEPDLWIGRRIGSYEIVERIGSGGMGEVYRASRADDQYRSEAAIKLVRAGPGFAFRQFKTERQILAGLDHPNIARLLDGGTTDEGVPYFVMELIAGQPIDEYCEARSLPVRDRLELFLQVCAAVQYAHQRLIVHRDIKPTNILVTSDGVPKLLDFGVARLLDSTDGGDLTVTAFRPMTPGYASPEQIGEQPVTTASDVYSMGVVLYELLTGRSPYRLATRSPQEIVRAIAEHDPERPSTAALRSDTHARLRQPTTRPAPDKATREKLARRLSGDLDNILLMALRKEPSRRYASIEQFAGDIRRHLANLPVVARKDTLSYRAMKFTARHKAGVAAAAAVAAALVGGLTLALHEAAIAREQAAIAVAQRARAERRFNDVRTLARSLMYELHDSIRDLPGSTPARKLLVSRALTYLDSLSGEATGDTSLAREVAGAYERIGDVQGQPRQANLGDPAGAAASYRKALGIRETLLAQDPTNAPLLRELLPNYGKLSDLLWAEGDNAGAMETSRKGLAVVEALASRDPRDRSNRVLLATVRIDHGYKQAVVAGSRTAGLASLREGSAMLEQLAAEDPANPRVKRLLAMSYSRMAEILRQDPAGRADALALSQKALSTKESLAAADPDNAEFRRLVAYDRYEIAQLVADMNDLPSALRYDREALSSLEQLAAADPANAQLQEDIGAVRGHIGAILIEAGQPAKAIEELRASMASLEKTPGARDPHLSAGYTIATDQYFLGVAHARLAAASAVPPAERNVHCREAASWYQRSLPAFEQLRNVGSPFNGASRADQIRRDMPRCEP